MQKLCLLALAACGGSSSTPGGNDVMGPINFAAMDAISASFDHTNGFSFVGTSTFVELTDYTGACALAGQHQAPTKSHIIDLGLAVNDASGKAGAPNGPGTYTVFSGTAALPASMNVAQVFYGDGCDKTIAYEGTSGTITLKSAMPMTGTFDFTISCAGFSGCTGPDAHLTGSFEAAPCSALDVNTIPSCQ